MPTLIFWCCRLCRDTLPEGWAGILEGWALYLGIGSETLSAAEIRGWGMIRHSSDPCVGRGYLWGGHCANTCGLDIARMLQAYMGVGHWNYIWGLGIGIPGMLVSSPLQAYLGLGGYVLRDTWRLECPLGTARVLGVHALSA